MSVVPDFVNCVQGSAEWFEARLGCVTASRVADALATLKNGASSQKREAYKMEILTEALTGAVVEHYVSPAMDFGIQNEGVARAAYEMQTGVEVELIGFAYHPTIKRAGASPDGLVGEDGLVEIKVPNTGTHLGYLVENIVPEQYAMQMFWQMACTGRKWCDFVSYDPRIPEDFSLFVKRLNRDDEFIEHMEAGVRQFIGEVNQMASVLLERRGGNGALRAWKNDSNPQSQDEPKSEGYQLPRARIPGMA